MGQFAYIRNHFEVDSRPEVIEKNREYREKRESGPGLPIEERFIDSVVFDDFDLYWAGNVPEIRTTKGRISFIRDLEFFEKDLERLELDQQGSIEYEARRTNIKYHCRVRFSVSKISQTNGRKTIYLFFYDPLMNSIS